MSEDNLQRINSESSFDMVKIENKEEFEEKYGF